MPRRYTPMSPRRAAAMSTDELAARTIRCLAKTSDPYWSDSYHSSLDRLAERTARKLSSMKVSLNAAVEAEERAELAATYYAPRTMLRAMADTSVHLALARPGLQDLTELVSELKAALLLLADSDDLYALDSIALAESRAVGYVVQLLNRLGTVDPSSLQAIEAVVELVLETGVMLSTRPSCSDLFREVGGIAVLIRLLNEQDYDLMLERCAIIIANLAEMSLNRYRLRAEGAIPALVALLDDTMFDTVRVAAATAISMMCCSDGPCQDALCLADGFRPLVRMADSLDSRMAKVAKLAIDCACDGNSANHSSMMRALRIERIASNGGFTRATSLLAKASTVLDEETYKTPRSKSPGRGRSPGRRGRSPGRRSEHPLDPVTPSRSPPRKSYTPGTVRYRADLDTTLSPSRRGRSPARRTREILQSSLEAERDLELRSVQLEVEAELDEINRLADELARTPLLSPRRPIYRPVSSPVTPTLRHIAACRALPFMTSSELYDLLLEMGCTPHRAVLIKAYRLGGAEVKDLRQTDMLVRFGMSAELSQHLQTIQRAAEMFERMTRIRAQGRLSELELRVFLSTEGLRSFQVSDIAERFREIEAGGDGCVSFWEWAKAYDWFANVLIVKGVHDVP